MLGGAAAGLAALAGLRSAFARETQPDDPAAPPPADGDPGAATEELLSAQNTFVRSCRANGGTSTSVGTRVVQCCYRYICTTCNFNYSPPSCNDTILRGGVEYTPGGGGVLTDEP